MARNKLLDEAVFNLALKRLGARDNARMYKAARLVMVEGKSIADARRAFPDPKSKKNKPMDAKTVYEAIERVEGSFANLGVCPYCGSKMPSV